MRKHEVECVETAEIRETGLLVTYEASKDTFRQVTKTRCGMPYVNNSSLVPLLRRNYKENKTEVCKDGLRVPHVADLFILLGFQEAAGEKKESHKIPRCL